MEAEAYWIAIEGGAITIEPQKTAQRTHDHAYDVFYELMHQRSVPKAELWYTATPESKAKVLDSFWAVGQTLSDSLYIYEHELVHYGKALQEDRERIRQNRATP